MNSEIKDIVDYLGIREKKKQLDEGKERLFKLKCEMSRMTFDRKVGLYVYYLDEIHYLVELIKDCDSEKREKYFEKLRELDKKLSSQQNDPDIIKYNELRDEYLKLLFNNDYFTTVNIGLREELSSLDLPPIYVEQSHFDHDKHIITKEPLKAIDENDAIYVDPLFDLESIRNYRHFYNKTSFKYLEGLCNDYSFDLKGKDLGKVRIRTLRKGDIK
jgi:hypothetical protein